MTKYLDSNQNAGGLSWQILGIFINYFRYFWI